ncbi:MAG: hypothetical protein LBS52_06310, partial [Dysgonamonadaceae bacterium]|nr:hypothetical protein [Dysgonamonadaceae bacterium]
MIINWKKLFYALGLILSTVLLPGCGSSKHASLTRIPDSTPKREFRGAWVQTVGQARYRQMNSAA